MSNQRYMMRGVSASKEDVHNAIKNIDKGIFPQAFCKIIPDILGGLTACNEPHFYRLYLRSLHSGFCAGLVFHSVHFAVR